MTPHAHLFMSLLTSILNLSAYISENCLRVKAHPCRPEPKPTLPLLGSTYKIQVLIVEVNMKYISLCVIKYKKCKGNSLKLNIFINNNSIGLKIIVCFGHNNGFYEQFHTKF